MENVAKGSVIFSLRSFAWLGFAACACLYVVAANGGPLYYYDSAGYLDNGLKILRSLGLAEPLASTANASAGAAVAIEDDTVNASRSAVYSLVLAFDLITFGRLAQPVLHTALVILTTFLMFRVVARAEGATLSLSFMVAMALGAGALGAMPFYVAYMMPDILAALLLMLFGLATLYAGAMRPMEWLAIFAIAVFAVLSHPSHLLIAAVLVPVLALIGRAHMRHLWWAGGAFALLVTLAGVGERLAFRKAAEVTLDAEVVYYPFLTARLIQDRVGYEFLQDNCPKLEMATCILYDELQKSDHPMRLTASHIVFERNTELGSYRLLSDEDQKLVADEQVNFAIRTTLAKPVATFAAIIGNTFTQAGTVSIEMTIAPPKVIETMQANPRIPNSLIEGGWLVETSGWVRSVDRIHMAVYALSCLALIALIWWPGLLSYRQRLFALAIILGILANAFVCGSVSQPAARYGARVVWLLPFLATVLSLTAINRRGKGPVT